MVLDSEGGVLDTEGGVLDSEGWVVSDSEDWVLDSRTCWWASDMGGLADVTCSCVCEEVVNTVCAKLIVNRRMILENAENWR